MSIVSLKLPVSLHKKVKELAERDGISTDQFIATAVAEKLAALSTAEYLAERAARGSKEKFDAVMSKVPDVEPEDLDKLPEIASK